LIQSEGINFLKDLPSFFVLLYTLQSGLNAVLDDRVRRAHLGNFDRTIVGNTSQPIEWPVNIDSKTVQVLPNYILHTTLGMIGRGTVAVKAKSTAGVPRDFALKIYWPEEDRPNEAEIISQAS
jgi:Fungal protein kinase